MISINGINEGILVKILIFTHRSDIDGMGGVVLSKLAFDEVDYVLCESLNLQDRMREYFDSGAIYKYDRVFVTSHGDSFSSVPTLSPGSHTVLLLFRPFTKFSNRSGQPHLTALSPTQTLIPDSSQVEYKEHNFLFFSSAKPKKNCYQCQQVCSEMGNVTHYQWECQLIQSL